MTSAEKAQQDSSFRAFAVKVVEFTRCKVFDFADGSFLTVWDNGRTEVSAINS